MTGLRCIALRPGGKAYIALTGMARCKADVSAEFGQSSGFRNRLPRR
jgi:hypothetical protein